MAVILASTEHMSYEDWLEHRKLGIGGSDASVVCGVSKYKSPVELWMEKTRHLPPHEDQSHETRSDPPERGTPLHAGEPGWRL